MTGADKKKDQKEKKKEPVKEQVKEPVKEVKEVKEKEQVKEKTVPKEKEQVKEVAKDVKEKEQVKEVVKEKKEEKKEQKKKEKKEEKEEGDDLRPNTAKKGPPRKKMGDFDQIVVEEKHVLPQGIILDNEDTPDEEEKNTSFDNNVQINRSNVNVDKIDKEQHGYLVRDIIDNNEQEQNIDVLKTDADNKNKIRMGRIGKKKEVQQTLISHSNNTVAVTEAPIKVESIEDVEALRKAVQNVCQ